MNIVSVYFINNLYTYIKAYLLLNSKVVNIERLNTNITSYEQFINMTK